MNKLLLFLLLFYVLPLNAARHEVSDAIVSASKVKVYAEPKTGSAVVTTLKRNDYISSCSVDKSNWICITVPDRGEGWVQKEHLRFVEHIILADEVKQQMTDEIKAGQILKSKDAKDDILWLIGLPVVCAILFLVLGFLWNYLWFLFFAFSALIPFAIAYYMNTYNGFALWFCYPSEVGWIWAIVNYILLMIVIFFGIWQFLGGIGGVENVESSSLLRFIQLVWGLVWGVAAYFIIIAVFDEIPESVFGVLFAIVGGGRTSSSAGSLIDSYGHTIDGHFSGGNFYSNTGNTFVQNAGGSSFFHKV